MTAVKKFTVNSNSTSLNGTCYKGYVQTTYDTLVKAFGEPKGGSADGKTTSEWHLEFDDGTVVTIYDWKAGRTPKDLYSWHIGARSHKALDYLQEVLETPVTKSKY